MANNFDQPIDMAHSDSHKWHDFEEGVIPLTVADMDFMSAEPIIQALRQRANHGVFGYGMEPPELREILAERLQRLYGWTVSPDAFVFTPGVVTALNLVCHALTAAGDVILVQPPVYPPILSAPATTGAIRIDNELIRHADGCYSIDFDAFEASITDNTRLFVFCNPHNPVGRVFDSQELERLADICLRHNVTICSDEIHCDLLFKGYRHIPIASLSPEIARQTITLMAPSKTYNVAGLKCSAAIIPDPALRRQFQAARAGLVPAINLLGYVAAVAAYRDGQPWLSEILAYLETNRDTLMDYIKNYLPGITMGRPEGTYLAWLDCRQAGIPGTPCEFFLEAAKVGLSDGAIFGPGGEGFVRLAFGLRRQMLLECLDRMRAALEKLA
ncbi:MAG: putative C-S lyase [Chloroflexi bacterium]|nr:putative C-S lyase [Chloroflexota bacterium]